MIRVPREFNGESIVALANDTETIGYQHKKERSWTPTWYHTLKINSEWIIDLNVRANAIKLLEENVGINLYGPRLGNSFLDIILKALVTEEKIDKSDFIKT